MKKNFLLTILILLPFLSIAQKTKFATMRIMQTSEKSNLPNAEESTTFGVLAGVGVVVTKRVSVTLLEGYSINNTTDAKTFTVQPSVRYSYWLTKKIALSVSLAFPYSIGTFKDKDATTGISTEADLNRYGATLSPGFMFVATKHLGFTLSHESMHLLKTDIHIDGVKDQSTTATKIGLAGFGRPSITFFYMFK